MSPAQWNEIRLLTFPQTGFTLNLTNYERQKQERVKMF